MPPSGKMLKRTCVTSPIPQSSSSNAWRACGCRGVRGSSSRHGAASNDRRMAAWSAAQASRLQAPGALPLKWRVSTSTRRIVPAAPSRTIVQSWPGPAAPLGLPAVAHVRRVARHDQVVPRAEEHVAARRRRRRRARPRRGRRRPARRSRVPVGDDLAVDAQPRDAAVRERFAAAGGSPRGALVDRRTGCAHRPSSGVRGRISRHAARASARRARQCPADRRRRWRTTPG